jgi:hypothetical protein
VPCLTLPNRAGSVRHSKPACARARSRSCPRSRSPRRPTPPPRCSPWPAAWQTRQSSAWPACLHTVDRSPPHPVPRTPATAQSAYGNPGTHTRTTASLCLLPRPGVLSNLIYTGTRWHNYTPVPARRPGGRGSGTAPWPDHSSGRAGSRSRSGCPGTQQSIRCRWLRLLMRDVTYQADAALPPRIQAV